MGIPISPRLLAITMPKYAAQATSTCGEAALSMNAARSVQAPLVQATNGGSSEAAQASNREPIPSAHRPRVRLDGCRAAETTTTIVTLAAASATSQRKLSPMRTPSASLQEMSTQTADTWSYAGSVATDADPRSLRYAAFTANGTGGNPAGVVLEARD